MALHFAARYYAFISNLFRPKEEAETWRLYRRVERFLSKHSLNEPDDRVDLAASLAIEIMQDFELPVDSPQTASVGQLLLDLFDYEGLFLLPDVDWDERHTIAEHFDLRAGLKQQRAWLVDFDGTRQCLKETLQQCLYPLFSSPLPCGEKGMPFTVSLLGGLADAGQIIEDMASAFFDKELKERELFSRLRDTFSNNVILASGGDPDNPRQRSMAMRLPGRSQVKDPETLCVTYLGGTPFVPFLSQSVSVSISQQTRFEHAHILGGTGHGKTQLLQYMIHHDLKQAEGNKLSVVVVDSQGDMIGKLSRLDIFTGSLADRLIIIDPTDIDHPPALNLFDAGIDRLDEYSPRQRELAFNSLVDIYGRFFGSLLGAELTAKQGAVFRYLARLMLTVPGATIHTLIELMDDVKPFQEHIKKLDPTARRFFEQEFSKGGFRATRQQIKQRLYTVLSIPTFDRLFSAPKSKINFFDALNNGSIILVNTAKDLLKADGAAIFGRFVLSLIEHAIMERATLDADDRTPTFLYVDEAQDYFDETIETMLVQGRKFNFGLTLAHQNLAQLSSRLLAVLAGNTTIKFAGGISDKDARSLASDMRTTGAMLLSMQKRSNHTEFALSVRNQTLHALKVDIEFGHLENCAVMTDAEYAELVGQNRERVCYVPEVIQAEPSLKPQVASVAPESTASTSEPENTGHRAIQKQIAAKAKEHGFAASVEYVLPNDRRIDVALFGHGLRIAVEVSVTNRREYELSNIEKALEAGFEAVWMIATNSNHRDNLEDFIRKQWPAGKWSKISLGSAQEVETWLGHYKKEAWPSNRNGLFHTDTQFQTITDGQDRRHRFQQLKVLLGNELAAR